MSLMSWNCQGAGSSETVQHIREMRKKYFPDFIFLMETKQKLGYMKQLQESLGYDCLVTVEPEGLSGGLAFMWKKSYNVQVISRNKRIIDLQVKLGTLEFFLTCVYGDPVREKRQSVWDQLVSLGLSRNKAWVLVGDFNELMSNAEKVGGTPRHESTFWGFRTMAQNCKLREMRSCGNMMSWAGWRDKVWIQCRLDRSFGNDEWFHLFPRSQTEYLDMWASDHRPIYLSFAYEIEEKGRGRFYFDKRMVHKPGVEEIVKKGWGNNSNSANLCLMERIANCRRELAKWKRSTNHNSRDRITRLKQTLELEVAKMHPSSTVMRKVKTELSQAYQDEEIFWRQRSKEQWLKHGDKNTPFYQNSVKGRKVQNRVLMLTDEMNCENFSEGAKGNIAVEYFRDLFMSSNPFDLESLFNGFEGRVTDEMNALLSAPVSNEEIKNAALRIKGSSAPGADGLTGVFYKQFWHIVGSQVCKEVRGFFETSVLPAGWNHTQLCLLPKIPNPTEMKDMRPISLCSVHYKIISKIMCSRLKRILPDIVSDTQGAFVSGRLITDNVIIAHEMVHGLRTKDSVAEKYMAVKTDMSKAYDRIEWCFLETLLEKMNFDRIWIRWVMACVSSVSYSVLLNGRSHGFIKPERGIRQGDPLSPFLFILCAEALVSCLNKSEANGQLHGIKLTTQCPSVHHLLFADDSLLMCRATVEESTEIMRCLKLYGEASGQVINLQKSSIIFGEKIDNAVKEAVKTVLGISKEGGEGTYLGLPECFKGSKRELLSFIREKLHGRLNGWFSKALSQGGKEILLKSVCLALPIYAMSVFRLPKDLCDKLTSAMTEFWWSSGNNRKKIPWVAWKKLCRRKEEGGLGFQDISRFNQALLGKQAWRIWSKPDSLLARILKARYFQTRSFLECGTGNRPSYAWRSILHGREVMKQGLVRSIGDGKDTNVWSHNWLIDPTPRTPVYRENRVVDLTLTVSDLLIPHTNFWDVGKVRQTFTDADARKILAVKVNSQRRDTDQWGFTESGAYTTRSGYRLLDSIDANNNQDRPQLAPVEKQLWRSIWKVKTMPKIRHFLWKSLAGALAVKERLASRGLHLDTTCSLCGNELESINHMLFQCSFAEEVWDKAHFLRPPSGFSSNSVFLNLHHLLACMKNRSIDERHRRCFPWLLWHIWKARNALSFENTRYSPSSVYQKAMEDADLWFEVNNSEVVTAARQPVTQTQIKWLKPPQDWLKCNIGSAWYGSTSESGASWILRDQQGHVLMHSRRAFVQVASREESELRALEWSVESMKSLRFNRIIFEANFEGARNLLLLPQPTSIFHALILVIHNRLADIEAWSLEHIFAGRNTAAIAIAESVIRCGKRQSYVARGGPFWLKSFLDFESMGF